MGFEKNKKEKAAITACQSRFDSGLQFLNTTFSQWKMMLGLDNLLSLTGAKIHLPIMLIMSVSILVQVFTFNLPSLSTPNATTVPLDFSPT